MAVAAPTGFSIPGLEWRVERVSEGLYQEIDPLVTKYSSRARTIETTILLLSGVTSGAFWALASDALGKSGGYAGAAISTAVTILTIYMYSSGLNRKRKTALIIFAEVGQFMATVRTDQNLSDMAFWDRYKSFEARIRKLKDGAEHG